MHWFSVSFHFNFIFIISLYNSLAKKFNVDIAIVPVKTHKQYLKEAPASKQLLTSNPQPPIVTNVSTKASANVTYVNATSTQAKPMQTYTNLKKPTSQIFPPIPIPIQTTTTSLQQTQQSQLQSQQPVGSISTSTLPTNPPISSELVMKKRPEKRKSAAIADGAPQTKKKTVTIAKV